MSPYCDKNVEYKVGVLATSPEGIINYLPCESLVKVLFDDCRAPMLIGGTRQRNTRDPIADLF